MTDDAAFELDRAIATTLDEEGLRHLTMTEDWNTPNGTANGGYTLAVLARAALDHAQDAAPAHPDLLSVSVSYFKPPTPGPAQVRARTLRLGRRVSVHETVLAQGGKDVAAAVVTLHDWDGAGAHEHALVAAPQVPAPDECADLSALVPPGLFPIAERYDVRHVGEPGWIKGTPTGVPEAKVWIRPQDGRPIDDVAAAAIVDGYPPVTAELGMLASSTVQLTVHLRRRPAAAWALMHVVTRHVQGGFHDEDVELWDEQGRLIAQGRQLAILS